jgi:hypothetical protein
MSGVRYAIEFEWPFAISRAQGSEARMGARGPTESCVWTSPLDASRWAARLRALSRGSRDEARPHDLKWEGAEHQVNFSA